MIFESHALGTYGCSGRSGGECLAGEGEDTIEAEGEEEGVEGGYVAGGSY